MRFRGFSGGSIWLVALCLAFVLLNSSHKAVASEPGPDWMNGVMTLEVVGDSTWKDGDPLDLYGEKERVTANEHLGAWYDFAQTPVSVYAIQTLLGAIAGEKVLPVGLTQWQKLDNAGTGDSYAPNPSSSGMLIIKNNNVYYSGANRTLEYTDNWLAYFSTISTSYRGDVTRKPGRSADRKLTLPNGGTVVADSWGGNPRFSKNGDWLFVNTSNGQARVKVGNFDALYFAPMLPGGLGSSGQISNNGRFAAVMVGYNTLNIYDLNRCASEKPDYSQRDCQKRSIYDFVKLEYGKVVSASGKLLNDFRPIRVTFVNDATVEVFSSMMVNGVYKYVTVRVRVDPGSQAMRYLALGDSFSSGEGSTDYYDATNFYADSSNFNQCHQSKLAYSEVLNKWLAPDWYDSVACSGAMMKDVQYFGRNGDEGYMVDGDPQSRGPNEDQSFINNVKASLRPGYIPQLSLLKANPANTSTITIGGNDIGFGSIIESCIWYPVCYIDRNDREKLADLIDGIIPKLANTYKAILQSMSGDNPKLYVVGYPRIFNQDNKCESFMSGPEREFANHLVDYLNSAVKIAANNAGALYIDTSDVFIDYSSGNDYRLCGNAAQAVNGLMLDIKNMSDTQPIKQYFSSSYHPNDLGHMLIAKRIRSYTNNFKRDMPATYQSLQRPDTTLYVSLVGDSNDVYANFIEVSPGIVINSTLTQSDPLKISYNFSPSELPPADGTVVVEVHSEPLKLGTMGVVNNSITGAYSLPKSLSPGIHSVHLMYTDIVGKTHDIYQYIRVLYSLTDFDGDGVPNTQEQCVIGGASGKDADQDRIDDACDPVIAERDAEGAQPPNTIQQTVVSGTINYPDTTKLNPEQGGERLAEKEATTLSQATTQNDVKLPILTNSKAQAKKNNEPTTLHWLLAGLGTFVFSILLVNWLKRKRFSKK